MYSSREYEPLTPQTLPFDNYSPQALSNGKNSNQIMSSSTNALLNTPQSTATYSSNSMNQPSSSSSTLVNLLHQKRTTLIDQPVSQEKQKTQTKQTRKSAQKKTTIKRLATTNDNNNNMQLPNPTQTMFNYPLTRKAKAQQHLMNRSASQDVSLNMTSSSSFATPSALLSRKHSLSTPEHIPYLNNEMVIISQEFFECFSFLLLNSWSILLQDQHQVQNRMLRQNVVEISK
jgi:hypothetical protein